MTDFSFSRAPDIRQTPIFFDSRSYSAFPHVVRLEGDELLLSFRQAPRQEIVRHTHPRSIITLIRSFDLGQNWQLEDASQMAAGGGQELGLVYLGKGRVGGALAAHEVVPVNQQKRAGIRHLHKREYPFSNVGGLWVWSDNYGLTWRLENTILVADRMQCCAPPVQLADGTLLMPVYGGLGRSKRSSCTMHRSSDGGHTWSDAIVIVRGSAKTRDYHEPVLIELEPGHLLSLLRIGADPKRPPGIFWCCESFDSGLTWTKARPTTIQSGACPRLLKLSDGRLLLTYGRRFKPYGLYATLSEDRGKTWGETWLLRPTPDGDQGYTSSIELGHGRIFTANYAKNGRGITGITGTFWRLP